MTTYTYRQPSEEWLAFRRRREGLGLSRSALAERSGVYPDSIYNAETGKTKKPHGSTLAQLQRALDAVELERGIVSEVPEPELAPEAEPAPTPVPAERFIRVTLGGVTIEVPPEDIDTLLLLVDRVMSNMRDA